MEKPPRGKTERLAASAGDFVQAARRLREQAEQESQSGFFAGVDNFYNTLFSSNKQQTVNQNSLSDDIQKGVEKMNQAFSNWKKDPANLELQAELSRSQQELLILQVELLKQNKPQSIIKLNDEIRRVSAERDAILAARGHQPKPKLPMSSSAAPAIKAELRITQADIFRALTHLTEKRNKSRMPYVWGARIGLAGTLGGLVYAAYSNSSQPLKASMGFLTLFGASIHAQTWFPNPTQDDAKRFLELQNK